MIKSIQSRRQIVEKVLKQRDSIHLAIRSLLLNKENVAEGIHSERISLLVVIVIGTTLLSQNTVIDICFSPMHEDEIVENRMPVDLLPLKLHLTSSSEIPSLYIIKNQ